MKLDRNITTETGYDGKYALVLCRRLRELSSDERTDAERALGVLERLGVIDEGAAHSASEFFVIRLKDKYAGAALQSYADEASIDDPEWAAEVEKLVGRAGRCSPYCKSPD